MSTLDTFGTNLEKVAYQTVYPTDKVVKDFTGSFNYTTDTIQRPYTLAGFANNVPVYRFVHGFSRPLFVEMFWSLDNSSYYIGGGAGDATGKYAIAYSDSTYIYIMPTALSANQIVYYKIDCSWIDSYDTTNPSVPSFTDLPVAYTQTFNSRNELPAIVLQDVATTSTSSAFIVDVTTLVNHPLGYSPNMKVFIEAFSGEVWPLNYGGSANPYNVDDSQIEAQAYTSSTQLILKAAMKSSNGTRKFWYILYAKRTGFLTANYGSVQSAL